MIRLLCFTLYMSGMVSSLVGSTDINRQVTEYLEEKCRKNADPNAWTELEEAAANIQFCLSNFTTGGCNNHDIDSIVCHDLPEAGYTCLDILFEKLQPCLDSETKCLPHFARNSFNYTITRLCEDDTGLLLHKLPYAVNVTCNVSTSDLADQVFRNCVPKLLQLYDPYFVLTEPYFCGELEDVTTCIYETIQETSENYLYQWDYFYFVKKVWLMWCGKASLDSHSDSEVGPLGKATELYITMECLRNVDANAITDLSKVAIEDFPALDVLTNPKSLDDMYTLVCNDIPKTFGPFLKKIVDKLDSCLAEDAKCISHFILNVFNDTFEALCVDDEKRFADSIEMAYNAKCEYQPTSIKSLIATCIPKDVPLDNKSFIDYRTIITENYFCNILESVVECIVETFKDHCDNSEMSKYIRTVLQPALNWCSTSATIKGTMNEID